jgi:hypothetical protein
MSIWRSPYITEKTVFTVVAAIPPVISFENKRRFAASTVKDVIVDGIDGLC